MPHIFNNPELEQLALTHRSFGTPHNSQLEWLGKSLLIAAVSELLRERFPALDPASLAALRAPLRNDRILAGAARRAGFPSRLRLGARRGLANKDAILAGALKAHVAAVHLDGGDARARTAELLAEDLAARARLLTRGDPKELRDYRSRLRDFLREAGMDAPVFRCEPHVRRGCRRFRAECAAGGQVFAGKGVSRHRAEQKAAAQALKQLE